MSQNYNMFPKAKGIEHSFQWIRIICLVSILACVAITITTLLVTHAERKAAGDRVYLLAGGKSLEANAASRNDNIPVEARDHVTVFHRDFFSLDPDEKVIAANIGKALYLADRSAKVQYDNLKERGYYTNLISANISQAIEVDSVIVRTDNYPYFFRCLATEKLTRTSSILTRSLVTEGYLRAVARSDNNPHGFLIEHWIIVENKDLKTETR